MSIFDALKLIGGLALFLFGMNVMGESLERRAGSKLRSVLEKLTGNKWMGFLTGLGITAVIQSSSATTVMVVGFINSGLMTLRQGIGVIMGANIGTTVTAWILSLAGINSENVWVMLLKPTSFTPILAFIGIIYYMFTKDDKKKDTGAILLGFAVLMFGMETMSGAVSGLADIPGFQHMFILFQNPLLGLLVGAGLTAIIQSSSASVGILQALATTGQVTIGATIPIIMGQNIGTCVTALLSAVGANKNAKRAAAVHLSFNVIGSFIWLTIFWIIKVTVQPAILSDEASMLEIAIVHSLFNILCTAMLMPFSGALELLAKRLVPDKPDEEGEAGVLDAETIILPEISALDDRLLDTPPVALQQSHVATSKMAEVSVNSLLDSFRCLKEYSPKVAAKIRFDEKITDRYEDAIGSYLVRLSAKKLSESDSAEAAMMLKIIGDFERISDHAVNVLESAEEIHDKNVILTPRAKSELNTMLNAVTKILSLSLDAFIEQDLEIAYKVEPLEQVIDNLKEQLRTNHIRRLQQGKCSIEAGFVLSDLVTNLERVSDHCSNIAGSVVDMANKDMNMHIALREYRNGGEEFIEMYKAYSKEYAV